MKEQSLVQTWGVDYGKIITVLNKRVTKISHYGCLEKPCSSVLIYLDNYIVTTVCTNNRVNFFSDYGF